MRFEWDDEKNRINIKKHNIDFSLAAKVFSDPFRIESYDKNHSNFEDRYITIGEINGTMIVITVVYTERREAIRIISARIATKSERRFYYDSKERY